MPMERKIGRRLCKLSMGDFNIKYTLNSNEYPGLISRSPCIASSSTQEKSCSSHDFSSADIVYATCRAALSENKSDKQV